VNFSVSNFHQSGDLFFVLVVEGLGEDLERLVDVAALHGAHFAKFKSDTHSESVAVLRRHLDLGLLIDLISDDDSVELLAGVLLLDGGVPVVEQAERLLVGRIVHQHHLVSLAKKVQCDILEDVLASDIDQMELYLGVRLGLNRHLLESVLAPLGHHVVVVELLLDVLVDDLRLAHARFTRHYNSRSQN